MDILNCKNDKSTLKGEQCGSVVRSALWSHYEIQSSFPGQTWFIPMGCALAYIHQMEDRYGRAYIR